jgi:hypothetical protein
MIPSIIRALRGGTLSALACGGLVAFMGCSARQPDQETLSRQFDELYNACVEGDLLQARRSLEEGIRLCEQLPSQKGQANAFFWSYCRLYVLDKRAGHASAESDLIKARYWGLRRYELAGSGTNEASYAATLTGKAFVEFIDKWDRGHTDGKKPRYVQFIRKP